MAEAKRDQNQIVTLMGVTDDGNLTPVNLVVDPTTGRLKVSAVISSGGGVTSLNGLSAGTQTFADVDDTNVTLTIASVTDTHTFTLGWTGLLAVARGGTGAANAADARTNLGLGSVNNTSDANKPVSTAQQTALDLKAPIASPTFTGIPAAPTADAGDSTTQIASTAFVQQAVRSVPSKEASKYATTAALAAVTYANGSAGVGATLTGVALGALGVDSSSPIVGDRILVKNQVSTFQNGIYDVTATGSGIAVFVLTRSLDFNQTGDIKTGATTYVVSGTVLAATTWDVNSADSPVIGTDAITFIQSAGPGSLIAGTGISISGVTVAINTAVTVDLSTAQTLVNKQLTTIELGHASDTTLSRVSAGVVAIEGSNIITSATVPVKATKAEAAAGTDDAKFLTALSTAGLFSISEGIVLNGKIAVSVATNDLTVALKGKDGNDPSATNPVYAMIGGTLRTITAALSVTALDATNWFNAGSAELATKEIDYFAYLGYNATDGVIIGFSRIPYASSYDDFSATTTNEKFCKISTITTAAATDYYNVIGRFAATLSATAAFTWTVPTFTAKNLIQRPIYETRLLTAGSTVTSGSGSFTSVAGATTYTVSGRKVKLNLTVTITTVGTAAASTVATLPFTGSELNILAGRENAVVGSMLQGKILNGSVIIYEFDGTFIGGNGHVDLVTGEYSI